MLLFGHDAAFRRTTIVRDLVAKQITGSRSYLVHGLCLCSVAYCFLRGISKRTIENYKGLRDKYCSALQDEQELPALEHGRTNKLYPSRKMLGAVSFVIKTAETFGEKDPSTGKINIFMFLNAFWLYELYVKACDSSSLCYSRFNDLIKGRSAHSCLLKHLDWKRGGVTQQVCGVCFNATRCRMLLISKGFGKETFEWLEASLKHLQHLFLVKIERKCWWDLVQSVKLGDCNDTLVILMDEANPIRHPRKIMDTQEGRSLHQLCSCLIGIIDHSNGVMFQFTSCAPGILTKKKSTTWESTDVFISLFLFYLSIIVQSTKKYKKLHFQVDGGSTARSHVLIMVMGMLVASNVFECIRVASLIPHHTHLEIDQSFSIFKVALKSEKHKETVSWPGIFDILRGCYNQNGRCLYEIDKVFKWRVFFGLETASLYQSAKSKEMTGLFGSGMENEECLRKPHVFIICKDRVTLNPVIVSFYSAKNVDIAPMDLVEKGGNVFDAKKTILKVDSLKFSDFLEFFLLFFSLIWRFQAEMLRCTT